MPPEQPSTALLTAGDTAKLLPAQSPMPIPQAQAPRPVAIETHPVKFNGFNGRFKPGHKLLPGAGNPYNKEIQALKRAIYKSFKPGRLVEVLERMYQDAKAGSVPAARVLLDYTLGRPVASQVLEVKAGAENQQINIVLGGSAPPPEQKA